MRARELSIGLPVYNGGRYLRETLGSILSQSFGDFELLISDNASDDATEEICRDAARRDPRVRYARNPVNVGSAGNFCRVFERSSAPLFKWACADDALEPGFLAAAVQELATRPDTALCYGSITLIDAEGREIGPYDQRLDMRADVRLRFQQARRQMGLLNVLQGVMRSAVVRRTGLYGSYPGSDWVLIAELALHGEIHELALPMLRRRMHAAAASAAANVQEQLIHLDPKRRRAFAPWVWRHSLEHLRAVLRAPLDARTKLTLAADVTRDMVMWRDRLGHELVAGIRHVGSRWGS